MDFITSNINNKTKKVVFADGTYELGIITTDDLNDTENFEVESVDDFISYFKKKDYRFIYCMDNMTGAGIIRDPSAIALKSHLRSEILKVRELPQQKVQVQILCDDEKEIIIYFEDEIFFDNQIKL